MKFIILLLLLFGAIMGLAQNEKFHFEGKIVDSKNNPVSDAYVINFRNLDKNVSRSNGIFDVWIYPDDSLLISHISYFRKVVSVHSLLLNPVVKLTLDTINIMEVNVTPNQKNDYERARENLSFLKNYKVEPFPKIKPDESPVNQMVKEQNKIFRAEAGSVTFFRFSPSNKIGKIITRFKKRKKMRKESKFEKKK